MSKLKVNNSDIVATAAELQNIDTDELPDGTIKMLGENFYHFYSMAVMGDYEALNGPENVTSYWIKNNANHVDNILSIVDDAYDFAGNNATEIVTNIQTWFDTLAKSNIYPVLTLLEYKKVRYDEIDLRTRQLVSVGFGFDGQVFSLSPPAQLNWTNVKSSKADFTYPLMISTLNNNEYSLSNANVEGFWTAGKDTLKGHLDTGRILKKSIFDAVDKAAVDVVEDDR